MRDVLRFVVISPELLGIMVPLAVHLYFPSVFFTLGTLLNANDEFRSYLFTIAPWPALAFLGTFGWKILYPQSTNQVLIRWPDYSKLRARVVFGIAVGAVVSISAAITYLYAPLLTPQQLGLLAVVFVVPTICSLTTLAMAALRIRELVERFK